MQLRSRIGLGTAQLGSDEGGPLWFGPQDRESAVATVRAALDAGIDWLDTAPFYGWGRAEEIVGAAVRGRRDEVTILTKCGTIRLPDGSWAEDGSPAAVRADLEASLVRLGTEWVDVLQLHDPDPAVPVEDTVGAMAELVAEGKVAALGLSNHDTGLLRRGHAVAPIAVVQHQWSILHHPPETDAVRQWCAEVGAAFLAWSPLASGFLVDDFDLDATAPGDRRRSMRWASGDGAARLAAVRAEADGSRAIVARVRPRLGARDVVPDRRRPNAGRGARPAALTGEAGLGDAGQLEGGDGADHEHGGRVDRRDRQLVEAAARRHLTVRRRRLDRGDRRGRVEATGDQLGRDRGPLRHAHEHDQRAADPGEGAPVDVGLAGAAVAGDDGEGRGDAAVRDGHAGGRGGRDGGRDAGHDLERDARRRRAPGPPRRPVRTRTGRHPSAGRPASRPGRA